MPTNDELLAEIQKTHPPMTAAQYAAWQRAEAEIEEKYPGQYVAYLETRDGDNFVREVVAASADWDEYLAQVHRLPPEVQERVGITEPREPDDVIDIGGADLWLD
ncbi:MAG: hypothetical protein K2X82_04585 [Gemmataceae bacterium]|nr:hypothetical protein [Gemmataceae bacterium]